MGTIISRKNRGTRRRREFDDMWREYDSLMNERDRIENQISDLFDGGDGSCRRKRGKGRAGRKGRGR